MIIKKLLAIFFMFMCFAASASTLMYNTQSPYPPHSGIEDACKSKNTSKFYRKGISIIISKIIQCSSGEYVAEAELLDEVKYFKIPGDHDLKLVTFEPTTVRDIKPSDALSYEEQPDMSNTVFLSTTVKELVKDNFIFDFQMHWPSEYGMDDTFNFQIKNRFSPPYTPANTIKYIEIVVDFYNRVDDKVRSKKFTGIGPIEDYGSYKFESQFYGTIDYGVVRTVKLTFMDGKTKTFSTTSIRLKDTQQKFFNTNCWFISSFCYFQ